MPTGDRPIRLVTFDLYDTLIELAPPRWERIHAALTAEGIAADVAALKAADKVAEDYYTIENGAVPIRDRPRDAQRAFRLEHVRRWLEAAGITLDPETVAAVRGHYIGEMEEMPNHVYYRLFDDVMPALTTLRAAGIKTALISNADADVTAIALHFAFAHEMNEIVTSALVGFEKPDPRTFRAALDAFRFDPAATLHIGDQPKSDVVGALGVGMQAALLDRYDRHQEHTGLRFATLRDLTDWVLATRAD